MTLGHGAAALRERFYRWDEGRRMTFTAESASRPGFRRFAEDITLEPTSDGTRLTWTFAMDTTPGFAPIPRTVPANPPSGDTGMGARARRQDARRTEGNPPMITTTLRPTCSM